MRRQDRGREGWRGSGQQGQRDMHERQRHFPGGRDDEFERRYSGDYPDENDGDRERSDHYQNPGQYMGSQGQYDSGSDERPGRGASIQGGSYWPSQARPSRQSFRGRGPKGYERSDERLKEIICEKLTDDEQIDASEMSVEVSDREVTLSGSVPDRQTKYQIEELVERCGGVREIRNELRIARQTAQQQSPPHKGSSRQG